MAVPMRSARAVATAAALRRAVADLAKVVHQRTEGFPAEDRDWLTDPLRHAADSAAALLADARRQPAPVPGHMARVEVDVHEVQTWTLLAMRHGHLSHRAADDIDRRCESILDDLHALSHPIAVATRRAA